MITHSSTRRHPTPIATGFSLVELLIAMTLGLLLLAGMIAVFVSNKRSTELNEATSTMQEYVRFAMNSMAGDVRMAGHQGCAALDGGAITVAAASVPMDDPAAGLGATAVSGAVVQTTTSWTPALPLGSAPTGFSIPASVDAVPGTHVLAVQFGDPKTASLVEQMSVSGIGSRQGAVRADASGGVDQQIAAGDWAIVSNCFGGDLFRVTAVTATTFDSKAVRDYAHTAPLNTTGNLTEIYGTPATQSQTRVMRFNSNVYFVGDTGQRNDAGDPITALYQQSLPYNSSANPPTELVRGVENLRLAFGVVNAVGQLRYVPPSAAVDPAQIRAVRIGLLMTSWDRIGQQDDATTYVLAGQAVPPATVGNDAVGETHAGDRRYRLAFNTTVKVRNYR